MNSSCSVIPPISTIEENHDRDWDRNAIIGMQGPYALPHQYLAIAALRHYVPSMQYWLSVASWPRKMLWNVWCWAHAQAAQVTAVLTQGLDVDAAKCTFSSINSWGNRAIETLVKLIGIHEQYFGGQEHIAVRKSNIRRSNVSEKCTGCGVCCDLPAMAGLCRHLDKASKNCCGRWNSL